MDRILRERRARARGGLEIPIARNESRRFRRPGGTTMARFTASRTCVLSHAGLFVCGAMLVHCDGSDKKHQSVRQSTLALGGNLLSDPGFEDGPPRELHPTDLPWGGEEENYGFVIQGNA